MTAVHKIGPVLAALLLGLSGQPAPSDGDPVVEARALRAKAQGISDADLPPVPKGIVEPPPLPPPEIHPRDARGGRRVSAKRVSTKGRKAAPKAGGKATPKVAPKTKARAGKTAKKPK